ncbi:hypothetical protein [Rosistilla carotiformis]|uniref:hypothetical protein n=1 Tax=Rosistilla carotiformis TaxID=2528017 RepID=UPI0011A28CBA|nr:hypothetical protein [Rosistilla carotiformis]
MAFIISLGNASFGVANREMILRRLKTTESQTDCPSFKVLYGTGVNLPTDDETCHRDPLGNGAVAEGSDDWGMLSPLDHMGSRGRSRIAVVYRWRHTGPMFGLLASVCSRLQ